MLQHSQKRMKIAKTEPTASINIRVSIPDDVLDNIFSFLPIKVIAQLGILSSRFKNSWTLSKKLHFDFDFDSTRRLSQSDFIIVVNNILNLHTAPTIQSFRLRVDPIGAGDIVERWIQQAIAKQVEEIDLDFVNNPFQLPSDPFSIESLRILRLCYCTFHHLSPKQVQGLSLLNTLVLKKVYITSTFVETVFNNCLLLECMDVTQCRVAMTHLKIGAQNLKKFRVLRVGDCGISRITIDAPTLQLFHYCGHAVILKFVNVLQLRDVVLNFLSMCLFRRENPVQVNDLSNVDVFSTTAKFLEMLFSETLERHCKQPQSCFMHLKEFQLFMEGASFCNVYDITSFLKSCPLLEKLFIDLNEFSFASGHYWESHHRELILVLQPYNYLKLIKLTGFKFQKHELQLVKYLLNEAKSLETLLLVPPKNSPFHTYTAEFQSYDPIFSSWNASVVAQIKILDGSFDNSFVNPRHSRVIWF